MTIPFHVHCSQCHKIFSVTDYAQKNCYLYNNVVYCSSCFNRLLTDNLEYTDNGYSDYDYFIEGNEVREIHLKLDGCGYHEYNHKRYMTEQYFKSFDED